MSHPSQQDSRRALSLSTLAFTICFAVWTIFSIIGIQISQQLGLSETQFGLLVGLPILTGSLSRIVLGVATDRLGGRLVYTLNMLSAALATLLLSWATTYPQMLLAALGVGLAGGSFAVGVAYVSRFYRDAQQGTALGIFGVGNVGAAVTKFVAPFVMVAVGWQATAQIWALALAVTAVLFWILSKDDPVTAARRGSAASRRSLRAEFAPLRNLQVWRFSAYYFFAFGAFVALALWLPHYLIGVYGFDVKVAGMVGAAYSIPASIFRAYGGVLSDRIGARRVLYATFAVSLAATAILSIPAGVTLPVFLVVIFILGFVMSLGKAAVYKHIPSYYPHNVGAVGGLVGMIGGLGGFALPLLFGWLKDQTGLWSSCFMVLFVLVAACALWMHASVRRMGRPAAMQAA
ncbi:MAG: MFS transporter [Paracoccus sp. (in: a-proteobacteria)]|jgi:NNP family nitrate/nitrite transporter-like MFS transporter|uniref:MFS transporter n=2 Tax=Paracoccus TaxID=265 RepID=UPI000C5BAE67|nr:nitrate/nitrite transporter [Paracoccus sp. UBA889]MAN57982.1 MFS transporter [Paracoccus sp. (in: a-proteobacteria)]|tara:strand:- start:480 stop:1691 length:1212 start_codon:yes stop_codon:yes gene_type:complete